MKNKITIEIETADEFETRKAAKKFGVTAKELEPATNTGCAYAALFEISGPKKNVEAYLRDYLVGADDIEDQFAEIMSAGKVILPRSPFFSESGDRSNHASLNQKQKRLK